MSPGNYKTILTWLPLIILGATGLIAWGQTAQRVDALEEKAARAIDDHDRIVRIETQIEVITTTISDVRTEQKAVKEDIDRLEDTVQQSFAELLQELRRQQ